MPLNPLRLLQTLVWGRLGMPRPGPLGAAGRGFTWKVKGAGGSSVFQGCHKGVRQGDVPRLFPALENKDLATSGFCSAVKSAQRRKHMG